MNSTPSPTRISPLAEGSAAPKSVTGAAASGRGCWNWQADVGAVTVDVGAITVDSVASRMILVDDDESVRLSVKMLLNHLGHDVRSYHSGEQLLFEIDSICENDLILLDQNMTGIKGVETCRRLRSAGVRNAICFLTGNAMEADVIAAAQSDNRCLWLQKPVSLAILQSLVAELTVLE